MGSWCLQAAPQVNLSSSKAGLVGMMIQLLCGTIAYLSAGLEVWERES